jgi:hypothetical protein
MPGVARVMGGAVGAVDSVTVAPIDMVEPASASVLPGSCCVATATAATTAPVPIAAIDRIILSFMSLPLVTADMSHRDIDRATLALPGVTTRR